MSKQAERYHQRRARGVCALCPATVRTENSRQPWCCRQCRMKLAGYQRARRARHAETPTVVMVLNDGRMLDISDARSDPTVFAVAQANRDNIRATLHLL